MKKWLVRNTDNALAMKLKTDTGLPMLLCSLLVGRGIYTAEQAQQYFNGITLSLILPHPSSVWKPAWHNPHKDNSGDGLVHGF